MFAMLSDAHCELQNRTPVCMYPSYLLLGLLETRKSDEGETKAKHSILYSSIIINRKGWTESMKQMIQEKFLLSIWRSDQSQY
jgi:hypothetical protein